MRILLCGLIAAAVCGCKMKDNPDPATAQKSDAQQNEEPKRRTVRGVGGIVLPEDDEPKPAQTTQTPAQPRPVPPANTTPTAASLGTQKVALVEWPEYKKTNPGVVEADPKVSGWDPYSIAGSAYASMPRQIGKMTMQHELELQKALNDGKPIGFKEFETMFKKSGINLKNQRPYHMYGYNTQTGKVVLLEDKTLKKKIYKEKGIPWDE